MESAVKCALCSIVTEIPTNEVRRYDFRRRRVGGGGPIKSVRIEETKHVLILLDVVCTVHRGSSSDPLQMERWCREKVHDDDHQHATRGANIASTSAAIVYDPASTGTDIGWTWWIRWVAPRPLTMSVTTTLRDDPRR